MPAFNSRQTRKRLITIGVAAALSLSMTGFGAFLIDDAMISMKGTANSIDDTRSISATRSAIRALKKQLGATVRDNAYWDDAYRQMKTPEAAAWATENWGVTTENYPLYDTALVIEPDGKMLLAYRNGAAMEDAAGFFDDSLDDLIKAARKPDPERNRLPVSFIRTGQGIALIGASAIQPYEADTAADPAEYKVLVFAKHLTPSMVSDIAQNFSIAGLSLADRPEQLRGRLTDIRGRLVGQLSWPSDEPGSRSLSSVRPKIIAAGAVFLLLLSTICAGATLAVRSVRREERMSYFNATHDALTGLYNRAGLLEQMDLSISLTMSATSGSTTKLHLIDLDGFKGVNDAWGHAVGDQLIIAVAKRLEESLPADVVAARLGGDEFAILSPNSGPARSLEQLSSDILALFDTPFDIDGRQVEIGGSVGAASAGGAQASRGELLRRSDLALYRAKELGRGIAISFEGSLDTDSRHAAELEHDIRAGLSRDEFSVAFQPLIDAKTGEISGVEALARWASPSRGRVAPDIFVGAAEKSGVIDQLGTRIMELAVEAAAPWTSVGLSVNVSPMQFRNPYFVDGVRAVLDRHAFDPKRLTLEVTEGVLIANPAQVKRAFNALKSLGVKIALDDFGCGYASIGALREFGFDRMKVDRSLVVSADSEGNGGVVLQATIALANALQIPVTAEGIETERQAALVKLCGCDELQGYLFGRPTSGEELAERYFSERAAA
ncbi:MAG: diguanylate cyclase/phosphodiesterase [Rhizobium sp.]|nr:diguanylate cyclase/phosphodiesterase [Rhizobium sp.]